MSSSILEQIRENMEDIETMEKAISKSRLYQFENPKEGVMTDHKIKNLITSIQEKSEVVLNQIKDKDGLKQEEIDVLAGTKSYNNNNEAEPNIWANFDDKLKELKDYHKNYIPTTSKVEKRDEDYYIENAFEPPFQKPHFSGEENNGRFVDMHNLFNEFTNLNTAYYKKKKDQEYKTGDYISYLAYFDGFVDIPYSLKDKEHNKYKRYLLNLVEYLRDFYSRSSPLADISTLEAQKKADFEFKWKEGTIRGWDEINKSDKSIYCQACKKQFTNNDVYVNHLNGKKHKNNAKNHEKELAKATTIEESQNDPAPQSNQNEERNKNLAHLEFQIQSFKEVLGDIINDTINYVRKKQTRTYEELEAENIEAKFVDNNDVESDDDEPVYNPKNLPLGWDGKPIPYWLYKLHGLGVEFKCEICGNASYFGRRAFEKHFTEWRHAYGMKCLRIPNTIHFREITSINDALALHQKLTMEANNSRFKPEEEEEFEDSEGNVLNRKTYEDLKRQGLL